MTARSHTRSRTRLKRFEAERRRFRHQQEEVIEVSLQRLAHRLVLEGLAPSTILGPIALPKDKKK